MKNFFVVLTLISIVAFATAPAGANRGSGRDKEPGHHTYQDTYQGEQW